MAIHLTSGEGATAAHSAISNPSTAGGKIRYFGDYELLEEIARGGMGVVYRARQTKLNRIVAVKMLLFGKFSSDAFVQRFKAEAEAAAALQHPNIVAIHEIGEHEGQHYFSMNYIEGKNLADLVRDKPLPAEQAATLLKTVAEAIHYAHQRGVLHRDLKPSNVLIDQNGEPHVTDFGLAKRVEGDSELTLTGQILGSPNYMPPEQAVRKRGEVSATSDVYSLGAILYHLLAGRPPFVAETLEDTLLQLLNNDPASLRLANPHVPRDLETICFKCIEKDPKRRYQSAEALAMDLGRWLAVQPIQARRRTGFKWAIKLWQRHPALAALISMSALLTAVLVAFFALTGQNRTAAGILVDFSKAYNAPLTQTWFILGDSDNNLASLPSGRQNLAGTTFDIRGIVQLRGSPPEDQRFPKAVSGIQVSRTCRELHFLHATQRARLDGVRIGHYVVHYGNGSNLSLPLIYSENIRDWWVNDDESVPPPSLVTAWTGSNAASLHHNHSIRLFKWTWRNPHPELRINTIDFISDMTECAPFLVAITAQP